jgi:hypothetical protein
MSRKPITQWLFLGAGAALKVFGWALLFFFALALLGDFIYYCVLGQ